MARKPEAPAKPENTTTLAWREWLAPAVMAAIVLGGLTWQLDGIRDRFTSINGRLSGFEERLSAIDEKIDRRIDGVEQRFQSVERRIVETNQRIDRVLEQQTAVTSRLAVVESTTSYVRTRVDRIAEKLKVSAVDPAKGPVWLSGVERAGIVGALEGLGVKVYPLEALKFGAGIGPAAWLQQYSALGKGAFVFAPDEKLEKSLVDAIKFNKLPQ